MKYVAKPVPVQAIHLTDIALTYEKWGGTQRSHLGDWLLSKGGEQYTCAAAVFEETYRPVVGKPGWHYKHAEIEAVQAHVPGVIDTLEGQSRFEPHDYIVTNPGGDRYVIAHHLFDDLYERAPAA